ncbi:JAB domain-containing protein [Pseudochryseolinea flava]|uniref:DNA repair protein n=1 Tax=Pseudochryseolinea flava TaxID=2059302 RepID=A0A364Y159_9BACT|nr:JAB domain-containing protein [Pseudochryseolinea flava]RAV99667.1 DNA repair protein [Pseudochryseolinea flava]
MENKIDQSTLQVAEIQLSYKTNVKPSLRPKLTGSKDSSVVLMHSWDLSKIELVEQFKVMFTNRANRVLGIFELSTGGMSGTVADPKLIFVAALKAGASGIILCHNHPSGNLTPSQADIELTRKIKEGSKILEIQVLDHIILTSENYYSFADEGLI